jgi:integrase-like protein
MAIEPAGNKPLVETTKADPLMPVTQNSLNRKNVLNQEDSETVPPEPPVESSGSLSRKRPKTKGADWTRVFDELKSAIKMRHDSPKTLKTYSGWARRFQTYVKSKEPASVSVEDVKSFLSWLAVEQNISFLDRH